jgi:hypothetical protein
MWEKTQERVVGEFLDFAEVLLAEFLGNDFMSQLTNGVEAGYGDG